MVNTRSTDSRGVLTNPNPSTESLVEIVTRLANIVAALENRINNSEGPSQRKEPTCQNGCTNGGLMVDPVVELKNLKQTTTVEVYQDSFEELLNKVELNESYVVSLFIGGLKEDIAYAVRMFKPTSLSHFFCLFKLQEANNSMYKTKHTPLLNASRNNVITNTFNKGGGNVVRTATTMPVQNNTTVPNKPFKRLTQQELEEKRAKHLCFYCDQKYMPGHKCSGQVFSLEVIRTDVEEDVDLLLTDEGVVSTFHSSIDEQPLISLNALTGRNSYGTMRVKGLGKFVPWTCQWQMAILCPVYMSVKVSLGCFKEYLTLLMF
ncbi:hypothetical protein Tco_1341679 [Tanacetum coccineum]